MAKTTETGWAAIDKQLNGGVKVGELTLICGRSAVGHSKFMPFDPNAKIVDIKDMEETFCPLCELGIPLKDAIVNKKSK